MTNRALTTTAVLLGASLLVGGCSGEPPALEDTAATASSSLAELVPYGREPWPGIITAGQPSRKEFEQLRDGGVKTVINLRMPDERGTRDEPEWMGELGLTYVSIPVAGAAGVTEEAARELDRVLAGAERPVLVHCGSSNRVGAVMALRAFHVEGKNPTEALKIGRAAGVTKLEKTVRELLE